MLAPIGDVDVTVAEHGAGQPILLLHGGGGPQTVLRFAAALAEDPRTHARVLTPTHPGFHCTSRPDALDSVSGLAALYVALLDSLDLHDVTVVGNSIGGWIAAEIALLGSDRVSSYVLIDAVGIEVAGHPIIDFFSLPIDQIADYSYHRPDAFRVDRSVLPPAGQALMASNREALVVYAGTAMSDSTLGERLAGIAAPTLVVWGESDRIADPDYGRAYADAIPDATFELLTEAGHLPQLETPEKLIGTVSAFVDANADANASGDCGRTCRRSRHRDC